MQLIRGVDNFPGGLKGSVLAIGNFDGIHRGHQAVLTATVEAAAKRGAPAGILTFDPHPRTYFSPHNPVFQITSPELKARLIGALGVDFAAVLRFDEEFASRSPEEFVSSVLVDALGARQIVTGADFRFGRARAGDLAMLSELGGEHGFGVSGVASVGDGDGDTQIYSSTSVRQALLHGNPRAAANTLGYWWTVLGRVVDGDKRGREIGFPTANIVLDDNAAPRVGIYAVRARLAGGGEVWQGAAYIGRRPTFDKEDLVLEVFLFDFSGDLYGKEMLVEFIEFIRGDEKFDGIESLVTQMNADCDEARRILAGVSGANDPMRVYPLGRAVAEGRI